MPKSSWDRETPADRLIEKAGKMEEEAGKVILLIDDEAFFLVLGKELLEEKGYRVITAQNGLEGLDKAKEARPDVILLDVVMPGMDGFETCKKLKEDPLTREIPVVILTASEDIQLTHEAFQAGADFTLLKGSRPERLFHTLTLACRRAQS